MCAQPFCSSEDIEDLTRKTGNFKQFPIFCSMLESAVRQVRPRWLNVSQLHRHIVNCIVCPKCDRPRFIFLFKVSDSVTLDLLTYADLELLRNRKAGVVGRPRGGQQSPALGAKRYLILIYTVEFDRSVHPLRDP